MRRAAAIETLGAYIRQARVRRRVTLRRLAGQLGITPSYLSDIENDRRVPAQRVLEEISRLLELDPDELLARAGRMDPQTREYLRRSPAALRLLRKIAALGLDEEALARLQKSTERLGHLKK